jgi:hypothetical protein
MPLRSQHKNSHFDSPRSEEGKATGMERRHLIAGHSVISASLECADKNITLFFTEHVAHCVTSEGFVIVKSYVRRRAYSECSSNFIARLPVLQLILN